MIGYYLIEHDDYWEIPLKGKPVGRFLIDNALKLEFLEPVEEETTIVIEGRFALENADKTIMLDVVTPTALGPVFSLYRKIVASAVAFKHGTLEVQFAEGDKLIVPTDPNGNYESWEVFGAHGLRIVCKPSGGLSIWQAEDHESPEGNLH